MIFTFAVQDFAEKPKGADLDGMKVDTTILGAVPFYPSSTLQLTVACASLWQFIQVNYQYDAPAHWSSNVSIGLLGCIKCICRLPCPHLCTAAVA